MKYINADNLLDYAFVNEDALVYPLRGICICFARDLPRIPYFLAFGERDVYFCNTQMPPIIEQLKRCQLQYTLLTVPEMKHCDLDSHPKAQAAYREFIISLIEDQTTEMITGGNEE